MQGAHNFVMRAPIFYVAQTVSPVTTALTTEILIRCFVKIVFHEHVSRGQDDALVVPAAPVANTLFPPSSTPATPPARKRCPPGKYRLTGCIPRPPDAFMLFRADFVRQKHVPWSIEMNQGSLAKIISLFAFHSLCYLMASHLISFTYLGNCWLVLPLEEKRVWEVRAKAHYEITWRSMGYIRLMGYIPRPPNAFMLFRADFVRQKHVPGSIETGHGSFSKIIGLFAFFSLSYLIASHLSSPQATAGAPYRSERNTSGRYAQSTQKQTTKSNTPNINSALYTIRTKTRPRRRRHP